MRINRFLFHDVANLIRLIHARSLNQHIKAQLSGDAAKEGFSRANSLRTADYADIADTEEKAVQNTATEALALQGMRGIDQDHDQDQEPVIWEHPCSSV